MDKIILHKLQSSNILITGAAGLVGSALVDLLLSYAEEYSFCIYAGCRSEESFKKRFPKSHNSLKLFLLDVTQPLISTITFDYIVHAASGAAPNAFVTDPVGVMKANLFGVSNLLDYGIEHGLKRFLYISSGESYGEGCPGKWQEQDSGYVNTMSMRSCYPSAKRAAETLCVAYGNQYNVETVVARLCHTYGPYFTLNDNRAFAQFTRNVNNGEDIILKSKGEQYRSWIYVEDCATALLYILLKGGNQEAYNVADENSCVTIREFAETIAALAGRKVIFNLPTDQEKKGATPITKALFDTTKLQALGWKPRYNLKDGLKKTLKA